ncbi:hypothetical protein [Streptomyces sp. NBRC 109706]|uniref:hypothetical protein n=1 Tax=Streptomyces sp. NBRC 109706 TaxID=1550035 RepID=UPI0007845BFA|nr:hypothetical protein [Streptomyces sp. NBRC 109706]
MNEPEQHAETSSLPPWPPPLPAGVVAGPPPEVRAAVEERLGGLLSPLRLLGYVVLVGLMCLDAAFLLNALDANAAGDDEHALMSLLIGIPLLAVLTARATVLVRRSHAADAWLTARLRETPGAAPKLPGRRVLWALVSVASVLLGLVCGMTAVRNMVFTGPDTDDGYVTAGLASWSALCLVAGVLGLVRALRHRSRRAPDGAVAGPSGRGPGPAGIPVQPSPYPPHSYRGRMAQLYSSSKTQREPIAVHRLSRRLSRWIPTLSRAKVLALTCLGCLLAGALAATTAVLPPRYGDLAIWPLLLLTIGCLVALLLELVHYGTHGVYGVLIVLGGVALVIMAWQGYRELALRDRGEWITAEVVDQRNPPRGGVTCGLRPQGADDTLSQRLSGCRDIPVGTWIEVFHDPEDRVPPLRSVPDLTLPRWFGGIGASLLLGSSLLSANHGHNRRRELDLVGPPPENEHD